MQKISSGSTEFDQLCAGGFPEGKTYLISGEPGTGKTIFCLQFLINGLLKGEPCMYITIDERPAHIISDALAIGWDLAPFLESGALKIVDVTDYFSTVKFDDYSGLNVNQILDKLLIMIRDHGAKRVAIDPVAPMIFSENTVSGVIEYIRRLIFSLEDSGQYTTLLTSYVPVGSKKVSHHGIEEFASSGIVVLSLKEVNNKYIRTLRIRKMRGTKIDLTEYSYQIIKDRGIVLRQPV